MSSKNHNLSSTRSQELPNMKGKKVGIVTSEWNDEITSVLRSGARETLLENGVNADDIVEVDVPGSYELPMGARMIMGREVFDAIICLGCVIKGETRHDEYINNAVAQGIMQLGLTSGIPIIFGVLTPNTMEQALDRAGGNYGNKGVEAATTALRMMALKAETKDQKKEIGFNA